MGCLTKHVRDTARGLPKSGIMVTLYRDLDDRYALILDVVTNADGRCDEPLLAGSAFAPRRYRLVYAMGSHFAKPCFALPDPHFVDEVVIDFGIADASAHYRVPLLVSRWSYSMYRGSLTGTP